MLSKAPRQPDRLWHCRARGAVMTFCLLLAGAVPVSATEKILAARYADPTTRYSHGVLGDAVEYGTLEIKTKKHVNEGGLVDDLANKPSVYTVSVRLSSDRVFEDIKPRLADIDQDGSLEVIVVETQKDTGAQLAIYNARGEKIAATPHIGTRFRWLAPVGAADLDGDGHVEIAYVDRPHLAKTLRIWRFKQGGLTEIATLPGLTNHRIGEDFITGGIRDCGSGPELVVVGADWEQIVSVRNDQGWEKQALSDFTRPAMKQALNCAQ